MLARVVALGLVALVLGYGGYRVWRRSLPPLPAVVARDADVDALVAPPLGARLERALRGSAVDRRVAGPKLVALTFDDGPYPVDTPALLAALRAVHVPATFFVIGRDAEQYPGLVRAIAAAGNELANHTETHPNLDQRSDADVAHELVAAAATLIALAPDPAERRYFRPPHGRFRPATLRVAQRNGYETILWTDDPGDWRNIGAEAIVAHVVRYATSPEIVLFHSGHPATTRALRDLVERYRAAGYAFVTVGELLDRVTPDQLNRAARTPLRQAQGG
jgi:peptidoglycan/xylan/chitin deacetylase (PgdA/CDA1 family)